MKETDDSVGTIAAINLQRVAIGGELANGNFLPHANIIPDACMVKRASHTIEYARARASLAGRLFMPRRLQVEFREDISLGVRIFRQARFLLRELQQVGQ